MLALLLLFVTDVSCQKYTHFDAKVSIVEKTIADSTGAESNILVGKVAYNLSSNTAAFDFYFPKKGSWVFRDSTLLVEKQDTSYTLLFPQELNIQAQFKNILNGSSTDYGLVELGFEIGDIIKVDKILYVKWHPPKNFNDFLAYITTKIDSGILVGVVVTDKDGLDINKTYFRDMRKIKGLNVPGRISSIYTTSTGKKVIKNIVFNDVEIY